MPSSRTRKVNYEFGIGITPLEHPVRSTVPVAPSPEKRVPAARSLPPDALEVLQRLCRESSQSKVAAQLNVSNSTISNALKGKYIGNVDRLAERIRGELLHAEVSCPVLGEISTRICQDQREKPFSAHNPQAVRLWRTCRECKHNPKGCA